MADDYNPFSADIAPGDWTTKVRRVVTGVNADGRSVVVMDDVCPHARVANGTPGYVATNIWRTDESPADNRAPLVDPYATDKPLSVGPTPNGSVFRVLELPPDADWRFDADGNEVKPMAYHTTASIDYAIVLRGEVWAILDEAETLLHQGDVLVQRGTAHAWANRSSESCVVAFVLIGGNLP
ncbi:MAG TPA: cupin domain-containing protein [Microbacterium sp.]|uniref:cupin domain-containing protein n=1 Tax=Microbacterium sp. TaxID=51671 RepID=UPI002CC0BE23|nr:cupin domain-containing protein [Microbacterium sp.]HWI30259.1 cupin domain-containing protein [Microbacterium sp.]